MFSFPFFSPCNQSIVLLCLTHICGTSKSQNSQQCVKTGCFSITWFYLSIYVHISVCVFVFRAPLALACCPLLLLLLLSVVLRGRSQIRGQGPRELIRSWTDAICQSQPEGGAQSQEVRTLAVPRLSPPSLSKHTNGTRCFHKQAQGNSTTIL